MRSVPARAVLRSSVGVLALTAAASAQAQETAAEAPVLLEAIRVESDPLGRPLNDLGTGIVVLSGDDLKQRDEATLGDTLDGVPGIATDSFGGGASRPVIRGQTAPRVKVLSDGSGLLDASEVSPDHQIPVEPLLLDGIEILRGPSALLYGGGAIGGAVNLLDTKIPSEVPENGVEGAVDLRAGRGDGELSGAGGLTFGVGRIAIRLEGALRDLDDYRTPFYTPPSHEEHGHDDHGHDDHDDHGHDDHGHDDHDDHDHDEEHEEAEGFDRLPGSWNRSQTGTVGASLVGDDGYVGLAYTERRAQYGLPGHSHDYEDCHPHGAHLHCGTHEEHGPDDHDEDHGDEHEHDHAHGVPEVDLVSRRLDLRSDWADPFAGVERLRIRGGYTDYRHDEIEDGVISTTFRNEGYDLRTELAHQPVAGLRGIVGFQFQDNDFSATGVESFIPQTNTRNGAVFVLEEIRFGDLRFEGAVRQEWQRTTAQGGPSRSHAPFSVSLASHWEFVPEYIASLTVARSQRAPHVQELYADGVHLATNTYEIGNSDLDEETAHSIELGLRKTGGPLTFAAGAYYYDYDGYIYARTLDQHEDFRLVEYDQRDAAFTGIEGSTSYRFAPFLSGTLFGDYVMAEFADGSNLPRIPAARLGARVDVEQGRWTAGLEYYRVFDQNQVASFETETPGYDMVNLTVAYDIDVGRTQSQVYLRATNLLDETALNHSSFIKDLAPLRGRHVSIGLSTRF